MSHSIHSDATGRRLTTATGGSATPACVDDITCGLHQMNVDVSSQPQNRLLPSPNEQCNQTAIITPQTPTDQNCTQQLQCELQSSFMQPSFHHHHQLQQQHPVHQHHPAMMMNDQQMEAEYAAQSQAANEAASEQAADGALTNKTDCTVIVTNVDMSVFEDVRARSKFESLFLVYDSRPMFTYLKSFRRVRLDFSHRQAAEEARNAVDGYKLGQSEMRCFHVQIIRLNRTNQDGSSSACETDHDDDSNDQMDHMDDDQYQDDVHLRIPKLTKQFLISPPASPPEGWAPIREGPPVIDVQLISAIANLVPGQVHEIHPGSESQPGIYVEVCEEAQYERGAKSKAHARVIPRTPNPLSFR